MRNRTDYFREYMKVYYPKNRERIVISNRNRYAGLREAVLLGYGNKCSCCLENEKKFLSIEHVNGGGTQHRRTTSNLSLMLKIIASKFPNEYTILCMNCNFGKRMNSGLCPHKESTINDGKETK